MQRLLHEPTVHFFAIAVCIFALYALSQFSDDNVLEINQREIDARIFLQEMTSGEPLTEQQRQLISLAYVEEQILVQEALAIGLDNDARIHDMLAQKMRHVLSGGIIQPSTDELEAYYRANLDRYRSLPTVSVDELVFDSAEPLPEAVRTLLAEGTEPARLLELQSGNVSPLLNVNHIDLANIFEPAFADSVFAADLGDWAGPFISNRGQHWLRVIQRTAARTPALPEIADRVRLEWIAEEEEVRLQQEIDRLRQRYSIVITNQSDNT